MIILVAVTINIAINGGLFKYAGKATKDTKNEISGEQKLAKGGVNIDGKWYSSIDEYINGEWKLEIDYEVIDDAENGKQIRIWLGDKFNKSIENVLSKEMGTEEMGIEKMEKIFMSTVLGMGDITLDEAIEQGMFNREEEGFYVPDRATFQILIVEEFTSVMVSFLIVMDCMVVQYLQILLHLK